MVKVLDKALRQLVLKRVHILSGMYLADGSTLLFFEGAL